MGGSDLETITERVLSIATDGDLCIVAIDGVGASGKTCFANHLATTLTGRTVITLHGDDFFNAPAVRRARGRYSPEGFWLDAFDYASLKRDALESLRETGLYRSGCFDRITGRRASSEVQQAPAGAIVLVEGVFLHRDELASSWDFSIYLDVPHDVSAQRMRARDHHVTTEAIERYQGAQRIYFREACPWQRASIVVDNRDFLDPKVIAPHLSSAARDQV